MDGHARVDGELGIAEDGFLCLHADAAGRIRYASPDILRLSGYALGDLIGADQGVLRDPAMPAGLCRHVQQMLRAGLPAGGHVRNLTRDGRPYWVFALTAPVDEGTVTVQVRPRGPQLGKARAIHAAMREAEAKGMSPEGSAALIVGEGEGQGFSLSGSLAEMLASEVRARCALRLARELSLLDGLDLLRGAAGSFAEEQHRLLETFRALYLVPTNMRILASRLEPAGGPISAIADSYKRASAQITGVLEGMVGPGRASPRRLLEEVEDATIGIGCTILQQQAREHLARDIPGREGQDALGALAAAEAASRKRVHDAAGRMAQAVRSIIKDGQGLQRLMAGLDQIRILGQVESGRNRERDGGLASIMAQLGNFHASIHVHLDRMTGLGSRMRAGAARFAV